MSQQPRMASPRQSSAQTTNQSSQSVSQSSSQPGHYVKHKHKKNATDRKQKHLAANALKCSPEDLAYVNNPASHGLFIDAVKAGDCVTIATHLRAHLAVAQARSPADATSHVQELANIYCSDCPTPCELTLELIKLPDMYRRSKVDLTYVVLRELSSYRYAMISRINEIKQEDGHDDETKSDLEYLHSRVDISDAVRNKAHEMLNFSFVTARAFAQLVRTYEINLEFNEAMNFIESFRTCPRDGVQTPDSRRESLELAIKLGVTLNPRMNHYDFLSPVLHDKANINAIYQYIDSLSSQPETRENVLIWCIDAMSEIHLSSALSLLKRYNRPLSLHPYVRIRKAKDEIWFITRFNLVDEFAELLCGNERTLQLKCLERLAKCQNASDLNSIRTLSAKWNLEHDPVVCELIEQAEMTEAATCRMSQINDNPTECFTMPESMIHIVDPYQLDNLTLAETVLLDPAVSMIGLDAEYVSTSYVTLGLVTQHCQWLQCATHTHTFLVDLQPLHEETEYSARLSNLIRNMLSSRASKYGMGFDADLKMLKADFERCAAFHGGTSHYYELLPLLTSNTEGVQGEEDVDDPSPVPPEVVHMTDGPFRKKEGGLAKLTRMFTGKRLDKTCQISLWSRRPLKAEQIMYAACDAYVQLIIVDALNDRQRALLREKYVG